MLDLALRRTSTPRAAEDRIADGEEGPPNTVAVAWAVTLLLILPLLTHACLMTLSAWPDGLKSFSAIDVVVLLVVIGYACLAMIALTTKRAPVFALGVYSTLIALAVVEVALASIFPSPPQSVPWRPGRRVFTVGNALPGISGTVEFTVNSLGLRGPEVNLKDVDFRLLTVGGSTTELLYVTDKLSWPWLLQLKLSEGLGKSVFVGNAGKSGNFSLHHAYQLNHYPLASKFDWVIVLTGINDMGSLLNRRNYERRAPLIAEEALTPTYERRAYYRKLAMLRLIAARSRVNVATTVAQDPKGDYYDWARAKRQEALARRTIHDAPALPDALETYRMNLREIIQASRRLGTNLLMMTQPTMYRADLPVELEALLWANNEDEAMSTALLAKAMDAFNRVLIEVCRQDGVEYIDLATMLPKDTSVFYDDAHFNISGSQKVAAILAEFFLVKLGTRRS